MLSDTELSFGLNVNKALAKSPAIDSMIAVTLRSLSDELGYCPPNGDECYILYRPDTVVAIEYGFCRD